MTQSLERARIRTMALHSLILSRIAQDTETYKLLVSLWDAMERERKLAGRKADMKRIKMMFLHDGTFTNLAGCRSSGPGGLD